MSQAKIPAPGAGSQTPEVKSSADSQSEGRWETVPGGPRRALNLYNYWSMSYEKPDKIEEGLYLGGMASVESLEEIQSLNVAAVLTVAKGLPPKFPERLTYTVISVQDFAQEDLLRHFDQCLQAIDEGREKGGIIVHCMAGVSRSATIVVAYIMRLHSMSLKEALTFVKARRPIVCPNAGFMRQLAAFEAKLATQKAEAHARKQKC